MAGGWEMLPADVSASGSEGRFELSLGYVVRFCLNKIETNTIYAFKKKCGHLLFDVSWQSP